MFHKPARSLAQPGLTVHSFYKVGDWPDIGILGSTDLRTGYLSYIFVRSHISRYTLGLLVIGTIVEQSVALLVPFATGTPATSTWGLSSFEIL